MENGDSQEACCCRSGPKGAGPSALRNGKGGHLDQSLKDALNLGRWSNNRPGVAFQTGVPHPGAADRPNLTSDLCLLRTIFFPLSSFSTILVVVKYTQRRILAIWKCTIRREYSQCCAAITTIHGQTFSVFPNRNSGPVRQ